jgi:flagellar motility protein MotE (MotC chaperone)
MRVHERYLDQMLKKSGEGDSLSFNKKKAQFPLKEQSSAPQMKRKFKPSQTRRKNSFSPVAIVFTMLGIGVAYFGYENIEALEKWMGTVNISFVTSALADDKAADKAAAKPVAEKGKADKTADAKGEAAAAEVKSADNSGIDFDFVRDFKDRKKALDQKEEELKAWETEIQTQKSELDTKIAEIQKIRKDISAQLEERVKADQGKIDTLVQVYTQMKPSQAAKVFETLDEDLAVDILTKMKKKSAADILNLLKADKAQLLSEKFAGYARKPAAAAKNTNTNGNSNNQTKPEGAPVETAKP